MKHLTATLEGADLRRAVAMAIGLRVYKEDNRCWVCDDRFGLPTPFSAYGFAPDLKGDQAVPIIEDAHMATGYCHDSAYWPGQWYAQLDDDANPHNNHHQIGPTLLVAAMRCRVSMAFGREVDLPA